MSDVAKLRYSIDSRELLTARRELERTRDAADKTTKSLRDGVGGRRTSSALVETTQRSSALSRSMGVTSGVVGGLATKMGGLGSALAAGFGFAKMVGTARAFEASMNDVQEKLNITGTAMTQVRDFALDMGAKTAFSASQVGSALSKLASLGFDAAQSMGMLPDVLNLAVASSLSLENSASITAKTLNQFGLGIDQTTRVVDLLAGSADSSAANVEYLAEVFSKAGPVASSLGISMEEVAAAAGVMADKGERAEATGTALRNMFDQLMNPSEATAEALGAVGIAVEQFATKGADGSRQFVGIGKAFDILKDSGADIPELMNILGREISALVPAVELGSKGLEDMAESSLAAASAAEQAETQAQGLPGAFTAIGSAWSTVQLALMDQGGTDLANKTLRGLAEIMRDSAKWIRDAGDKWRDFKDEIRGVGSLSAATNPRIDGLHGVVRDLIESFDKFDMTNMRTQMTRGFGDIEQLMGEFSRTWNAWFPTLAAASKSGWSFIADAAEVGFSGIGKTMETSWGLATGFLTAALRALRGDFDGAWDSIAKTVEEFARNIVGTFKEIGPMLSRAARDWLDSVLGVFDGGTREAVDSAIQFAGDIVGGVTDGLLRKAGSIRAAFVQMFDFLPSVADETMQAGFDMGGDTGEGFFNGIFSWAGDVYNAASELASAAIDGIKMPLKIRSPSKVMEELGGYVAEGLAIGITRNAKSVEQSTERLAIIIGRMSERIQSQIIALTEGAEASRLYELGLQGITGVTADNLIAGEKLVESLENQKRLWGELEQGIVSSIVNASSVKEAFENLGDFMTQWLKQKIAEFAANKIMTFIGVGGGGTSGGGLVEWGQALYGAYQSYSGGSSGGGSSGGDGGGTGGQIGMIASAIAGIKSLGSALTGFYATITGVSTAATTASVAATSTVAASEAGMGAAIANSSAATSASTTATASAASATAASSSAGAAASSASASIGVLVAAWVVGKVAAYQYYYAVAEAAGAANAKAVAMGASIGGIWGAAIGSAMGGSKRLISEGFDLAFKDGELTGQSFQHFRKERSWWKGTVNTFVYGEIQPAILDVIGGFFRNIGNQITVSATALGVEGASSIMDSFENSVRVFDASNAEDALTKFMEDSARQAYQALYDSLGPALQAAIGSSVDMVDGELEDIGNAFNTAIQGATIMAPLMREMGFTLSENSDLMTAANFELAEAAGGASVAINLLSKLVHSVGFASDATNPLLIAAQASVDSWNVSLQASANQTQSVINVTKDFVTSLDGYGAASYHAKELLNLFITGVDEATGALIVNRSSLQSYIDGLDTSTIAGANAHQAATLLADSLDNQAMAAMGLNGQTIDSAQGVYDYIAALQESVSAGTLSAEAFGELSSAALGQLDSILALEEATRQAAIRLDTVASVTNFLNLQYDSASPLAQTAADSLIMLMGGMEAFTAATNSYYENFFDDAEKTQLELAQSAAAVQVWHGSLSEAQLQLAGITDGTIDTTDEFRLLVESLDLTTASGQAAFASAMGVSDAFLAVVGSGDSMDAIIAALPEHLQGTFQQMVDNAQTTSDQMNESAANIFHSSSSVQSGLSLMDLAFLESVGVLQEGSGAIGESTYLIGDSLYTISYDADGAATVIRESASSINESADSMGQELLMLGINIADMESIYYNAGQSVHNSSETVADAAEKAGRYMSDMARDVQGAAGSIQTSAGTAQGGLSTLNGAIGSIGGAAQGAATSIAGASGKIWSAAGGMQATFERMEQIYAATPKGPNSHALGLNSVPYDDYNANLHAGEMVVRADISDKLRSLGVTATSIPASFLGGSTASKTFTESSPPPQMPHTAANDSGTDYEALRAELQKLRESSDRNAQQQQRILSIIADSSIDQVSKLETVEQTNGDVSRKLNRVLSR